MFHIFDVHLFRQKCQNHPLKHIFPPIRLKILESIFSAGGYCIIIVFFLCFSLAMIVFYRKGSQAHTHKKKYIFTNHFMLHLRSLFSYISFPIGVQYDKKIFIDAAVSGIYERKTPAVTVQEKKLFIPNKKKKKLRRIQIRCRGEWV